MIGQAAELPGHFCKILKSHYFPDWLALQNTNLLWLIPYCKTVMCVCDSYRLYPVGYCNRIRLSVGL